ncbi:SDR family NAD(P)-dependent oxidoreductase [Agromyces aurantiacus]|uniref:SDR family NAD(P)-dependent oxidoreductase n=1 Tax=Agromyces aurantiacus TaxID=165814 RepID=A0ABV9R2Z1_9MICO|nr:SDR family NAD(P)-dependent oxidoreductase [Agromyces aurantiacus]MBM7502648.1 NADP-dependent 3-hydroxy acid dehydrogenase YdfG [Agromyces aurantiacus]
MTELQDRVVVIAGATSASGRAVARALVDAGARVVAVGSHQGRLDELEVEIPGLVGERADLTDGDDVLELAMRVHAKVGDVDGVVHLVGGWRGGGGIPGQTEEDYRVLERSLTALRYVSRVFWDDLVGSDAGRIAIVSSTTVEKPTAGGANYTAIKAASESWMRSLADGFAKADSRGAAVTFRVKALAGLEQRLAEEVVALWSADAAASELNGRVTTLAG